MVAACAAGGFVVFGCGLALLFEFDPYWRRPRDAGIDPFYAGALFAGIAAGVAAPWLVWRALLPGSAPAAGVAVGLALALAALVVWFGLLR